MPTPPQVLAQLLRSDPGRPRLTFYDDTPGPTQGERVELSAHVLANWVSKAANALQEEWDLGPGSRVRLDLPPHWRAAYWALATWSVGAALVLDGRPADLVVTDDPTTAKEADGAAVLVTLPALARSAAVDVSALGGGVMDEARELATFGDQFAPWDEPAGSAVAFAYGDGEGEEAAYDAVVPVCDWAPGVRLHTASPDLRGFLLAALGAWSLDGSVVLSRGAEPVSGRAARLASEGVTAEA